MSDGRAAVADLFPNVSRETWDRLEAYVELLTKWQQTINLVSSGTLPSVWIRHIADSLQLRALAGEESEVWFDIGSGAGFPGLVIASVLANNPAARMHLIESDTRKCSFLREAARAMSLKVEIHNLRAEKYLATWEGAADVVTARALAPTNELLTLAYPLLKTGALGLFPKGQDVEAELTVAAKSWKMNYSLVPSISDLRSSVLVVSSAEPLQASTSRR